MAFKDFPVQQQGVALLQRSLERGRLAHAYLFIGDRMAGLESLARTLAKTLNCLKPVKKGQAIIDCCDHCSNCQKIEQGQHADIHWVRPESKSRVIVTDQMRELMQEIHLRPSEAEYKVAIIVAADRLRVEAANAFLKTLEEPPAKSILILLTSEPERILETIRSRCLRLKFAGQGSRELEPAQMEWLNSFSELAAAEHKSLLGRYSLMDALLQKLNALKASIEESLTASSPLQRYKDAEPQWQEKWEEELKAAMEAEYRRQRADLLAVLQAWLRDVWLHTLGVTDSKKDQQLLNFPQVAGTKNVAQRISSKDALENLNILEQLQRWLHTNVQEALTLEVSLLKLRL
jgi:DNA polymerase-3 subunit delta'